MLNEADATERKTVHHWLKRGCAYAVFWLGHSGWWFLLAVLLLDTVRTKVAKS